jgi:hypothetical protein
LSNGQHRTIRYQETGENPGMSGGGVPPESRSRANLTHPCPEHLLQRSIVPCSDRLEFSGKASLRRISNAIMYFIG